MVTTVDQLPDDPAALKAMVLEEAEQIEADSEEAAERADPRERSERTAKRRANRDSLPVHLPRIETIVDIDDHACPCCRNDLHRIGEDVSERLDIPPAQLRVIVVRRPKYASHGDYLVSVILLLRSFGIQGLSPIT